MNDVRHGPRPLAAGVPKQLLAEPNEAPSPVRRRALGGTVKSGSSKHRGRLCALFALPPATQPNNDEKDEGATECHEQDLPPLESASLDYDCRRIDSRNRWERGRCARPRWRGEHQFRETNAEARDDVGAGLAVRSDTCATAEDLRRTRACKAVI